MDKQDVLHIYNGVLLTPALNGIPLSRKKKEIMPFAATWMDLEIIILSEESQKEKDKYHMISQMWSLKYDTTICETETDSQT